MASYQTYSFFSLVASELVVIDGAVCNRRTGCLLHNGEVETDVAWLADYIYCKYYSNDQGGIERLLSDNNNTFVHQREDATIAHQVIKGCSHRYYCDNGWNKCPQFDNESLSDGDLFCVTNGLVTLMCSQKEYVENAQEGFLFMPAVNRHLLPGWICITGEKGFQPELGSKIYRYYHAIESVDVISLIVNHLTESLNQSKIGYRVKISNSRLGIMRNDALVLYTQSKLTPSLLRDISKVFPSSWSNQPKLPLCAPIRYGWGFAYEVVQNGSSLYSYGMYCCRVIAEALFYIGDCDATDSTNFIITAFKKNGRNPLFPFLENRHS